MESGTSTEAKRTPWSPILSACGIGATISAEFGETNARIPLVPKIYSRAIGMAVTAMARERLLEGSLVSAEKIAMYSSPVRAPKVILLNTLSVNRERGGTMNGKG